MYHYYYIYYTWIGRREREREIINMALYPPLLLFVFGCMMSDALFTSDTLGNLFRVFESESGRYTTCSRCVSGSWYWEVPGAVLQLGLARAYWCWGWIEE